MTPVAVFTSVLLLAAPALAQIDCNQGMPPIEKDAASSMSALDFTHAVSAKETVEPANRASSEKKSILMPPSTGSMRFRIYSRISQPLRNTGLIHFVASRLLLNSPFALSHISLPS